MKTYARSVKEAHCSGTWRAGFSYPTPSMHSDPEENIKLERKMIAGINKLEDTKKHRGSINKTQSWFFVSANKKDQSLANIIKKRKEPK